MKRNSSLMNIEWPLIIIASFYNVTSCYVPSRSLFFLPGREGGMVSSLLASAASSVSKICLLISDVLTLHLLEWRQLAEGCTRPSRLALPKSSWMGTASTVPCAPRRHELPAFSAAAPAGWRHLPSGVTTTLCWPSPCVWSRWANHSFFMLLFWNSFLDQPSFFRLLMPSFASTQAYLLFWFFLYSFS